MRYILVVTAAALLLLSCSSKQEKNTSHPPTIGPSMTTDGGSWRDTQCSRGLAKVKDGCCFEGQTLNDSGICVGKPSECPGKMFYNASRGTCDWIVEVKSQEDFESYVDQIKKGASIQLDGDLQQIMPIVYGVSQRKSVRWESVDFMSSDLEQADLEKYKDLSWLEDVNSLTSYADVDLFETLDGLSFKDLQKLKVVERSTGDVQEPSVHSVLLKWIPNLVELDFSYVAVSANSPLLLVDNLDSLEELKIFTLSWKDTKRALLHVGRLGNNVKSLTIGSYHPDLLRGYKDVDEGSLIPPNLESFTYSGNDHDLRRIIKYGLGQRSKHLTELAIDLNVYFVGSRCSKGRPKDSIVDLVANLGPGLKRVKFVVDESEQNTSTDKCLLDDAVRVFASNIVSHTTLEKVELGGPFSRSRHAVEVFKSLVSSKATLAHFALSSKTPVDHILFRDEGFYRSGFAKLKSLEWHANNSSESTIPILKSKLDHIQLEKLDLSGTHLTVEMVSWLVRSGILENVVSLTLDSCKLDDKKLIQLADGVNWQKLRHISLKGNKFTNTGMDRLFDSTGFLEEMDTIDVSENSIGLRSVNTDGQTQNQDPSQVKRVTLLREFKAYNVDGWDVMPRWMKTPYASLISVSSDYVNVEHSYVIDNMQKGTQFHNMRQLHYYCQKCESNGEHWSWLSQPWIRKLDSVTLSGVSSRALETLMENLAGTSVRYIALIMRKDDTLWQDVLVKASNRSYPFLDTLYVFGTTSKERNGQSAFLSWLGSSSASRIIALGISTKGDFVGSSLIDAFEGRTRKLRDIPGHLKGEPWCSKVEQIPNITDGLRSVMVGVCSHSE